MTRLARLAVIMVAIALSPLAVLAPAAALADTASTTLHVVGNGRVFVTPDRATVTINVNRSAATRQLARRRVNAISARIIGGLVGTGIERPSIQTSSITLNSSQVTIGPVGHRRHRISYNAEIDLTVTTKQIKLLSPLFAIASRDGASSFAGPSFDFSDPSAGLVGATAAALRDARRRADAAAAALGMHVIGVQSVDLDPGSGSAQSPSAPAAGGSAPRSAPPKTPVLTGRQEVDAQVDVVYELGS